MSILGFLGFGEAAYYIAKGLVQEGMKDIHAYDVALGSNSAYKQTVLDRAKDAGATCMDSVDALAQSSDIVFCLVPSSHDEEACLGILPLIRPTTLMVDGTSSSPLLKERLAAAYAAKGLRYVDAAIMTPPMNSGHKAPIKCSGDGAEEWAEAMRAFGMNIEVLPGGLGMASKTKLARSVLMKGAEALFIEGFLFARAIGLEKEIMESVASSFNAGPVQNMITNMMCTGAVHAGRRAHEAEEAMALMEAVGIEPAVTRGSVERLKRMEGLGLREDLEGIPPKDLESLYTLWEEKNTPKRTRARPENKHPRDMSRGCLRF